MKGVGLDEPLTTVGILTHIPWFFSMMED